MGRTTKKPIIAGINEPFHVESKAALVNAENVIKAIEMTLQRERLT